MTSGGDRKSADFSSRQNDALKRRTKDRISKELGIGSSTVERAECFADQYTKLQTGQNVQSAPKLGMNSKTELLETSRTALDQLNFELSVLSSELSSAQNCALLRFQVSPFLGGRSKIGCTIFHKTGNMVKKNRP